MTKHDRTRDVKGRFSGLTFQEALEKYDPNQPRDSDGKWTEGGGSEGAAHPGHGYSAAATVDGEGKIHTSNINDAARALYEGKKVVLTQPKQVSTLLVKLAGIARTMERLGVKAPNFDLCGVSVQGTNLFCAQSKGIPRVEMPQLKGKPIPGSLASRTVNAKGEADITQPFLDSLKKQGVKIEQTEERATFLKASQSELNGAKVAGMAGALRAGKIPPEAIVVSRDNYVVDGHHRWAATVGVDLDDGHPGDLRMPVYRVDMDIIDLLHRSKKFAARWGIPQAAVKFRIRVPAVSVKYSPDQERDERGRWAAEDGGGGGGSPATDQKVDAQKILEKAGLKVISYDSMPAKVKKELPRATESADVPLASAARALPKAIDEVAKRFPRLKEICDVYRSHVSVVMTPYKPEGAMMTSVTGPNGISVFINLAHNGAEDITQPAAAEPSFALQEARRVYKETGSLDQANETHFRVSMMHEMAHALNRMTDGMIASAVSDSLAEAFDVEHHPTGTEVADWLRKNVSGYAASSNHEMMAEVFSKVMNGWKIPKELKYLRQLLTGEE